MSPKILIAVFVAAVPLASSCDNAVTAPRTAGASAATVATGFSPWSPTINIEQSIPGADPSQ